MPAIDLLLFASLALFVGVVLGWTIGYRRGKAHGDAAANARCSEYENKLKELQTQAKQLLGVQDPS